MIPIEHLDQVRIIARLYKKHCPNTTTDTIDDLIHDGLLQLPYILSSYNNKCGTTLRSFINRCLVRYYNKYGVRQLVQQKYINSVIKDKKQQVYINTDIRRIDDKDQYIKLMSLLTPKEKQIFILLYEQNKTLLEVGKLLQLSQSRIQQIHAEALERLRVYCEGNKIR